MPWSLRVLACALAIHHQDTERAIHQYIWSLARRFLSRDELAYEPQLPQACFAPAVQQEACHRNRGNARLRYLHQRSRRIEFDIRYAIQPQACRKEEGHQISPRTTWSALAKRQGPPAKRRTPPHLRLQLAHITGPQSLRITIPDIMTAALLALEAPAASLFAVSGPPDPGRQTAIVK